MALTQLAHLRCQQHFRKILLREFNKLRILQTREMGCHQDLINSILHLERKKMPSQQSMAQAQWERSKKMEVTRTLKSNSRKLLSTNLLNRELQCMLIFLVLIAAGCLLQRLTRGTLIFAKIYRINLKDYKAIRRPE